MKYKKKRSAKRTGRMVIYILPNLFTSASLFGGFYAIIAAIQGRYEAAAIAIIISAMLDGLDGRIARFTHTSSHFGSEYDSLSDLVAFGVAPGILAFSWALKLFGRLGWLAAFMYVICGALRLARFNVQKNSVEATYFKGLPIPAAACFIATLTLFTKAMGGFSGNGHIIIIIMIYILSFLMVSTINYFSFKEFDIRNQRPFHVLVSIILVSILIAYEPKILLFFIMLAYVVSGPVITIYRLHKKGSHVMKPAHHISTINDDKEIKELNN